MKSLIFSFGNPQYHKHGDVFPFIREEDRAFQQCVDDACREGNAEDVAAEAADGLIH